MITPHINANKNDFASRIIMSGDPVRVQYIASNFLKNVREVTNVRFILGFTGYYKNVKISIMSHGIGIPSALIYIHELVKYYHVKKIIRLGTCGTVRDDIELNDILIAMGACTDSNVNRNKFNNYDFASISDFDMLYNTVMCSKKIGIHVRVGNFFTTDLFYTYDKKIYHLLNKYNILGIDMETSGIYNVSAELGIQSISICLVSDHLLRGQRLSTDDRVNTFNNMIQIALETMIM
ncbi:purine-nucleoside phosphorylase [Buchnera aphidicola]|uniref:Purine nucleoside phosphorylase DeoD-type n=1 Tax=Buchnera aphidicola (Stegophylla sp.) TaxID=2315800 RepID=A0A4D6YLH3_9GAMM|nr:purine-nucleoside phosphorylase [Buchnera aphidicola (Stegophylla sp.)]QCI26498.1 purine-nucleoside phosphorylase [Buchnera aphidicola (Stegophylla sp.)]